MSALAQMKRGPRSLSTPAGKVVQLKATLPRAEREEEYLLSCCLKSREDAQKAKGRGVTESSFFLAKHRVLWSAIDDLIGRGESPGAVECACWLQENNRTSEIEPDEVFRIDFVADTSAQLPNVLGVVLEKAKAREKLRAAWGLIEAIQSGDYEAAATAERSVSEAGQFSTGRLPEIASWESFITSTAPGPAEIVGGVLHRGSKMMLGGGSKSFKTWVLTDLALSVATGTPWWGMRTVAGRVLMVNFELQEHFFRERCKMICKAKEIASAPLFDSWHLRGYAADLTELVPHFAARASGQNYDLIILDPIYKCLGERDENAAGDVAGLLNEVEALAVRTGAAVAFGHHFSKGNQSEKSAQDRVSGSGVWARDPDSLITLTPHEADEHFAVDFTLRNLPPKDSQVIRWKPPCMEVALGLDPAALKKPGRPKEHSVEALQDLLREGSMSYSEMAERAGQQGISQSTFKRLLREATDRGLLIKAAGRYALLKKG